MPPTTTPAVQSPRMTKVETAQYIPCSMRTLDRLPIPKIRIGGKERGKVLYERAVVDEYLRSQQAV